MTIASDEGEDDTPTNPALEAPTRTQAVASARPSTAPPGFTPRAPMLPKAGASASQRPPSGALGSSPGTRPAFGAASATRPPPLSSASVPASSTTAASSPSTVAPSVTGAPPPLRTSTLPGAAAAERASSPPLSTPGFLMPKPAAAATGSGEPADPWRERLASIEVQAQATRALAQRTADDASAMRQRAEAAESRVRALESELGGRVVELERALAEGASRAGATDRPPAEIATPEGLAERVERVDRLASQARVALDTIQQDLAEHARLFQARKARMDSLEARVARAEDDPRIADLVRKVESFDLTLARLLPQLEGAAAVDARVAAIEARAAASEERVRVLDARSRGLAEALADVERRSAVASERSAALDARVALLEGAAGAGSRATPSRSAEPEDELRSLKGVGPKLAKQLREAGVTTVAEIAAWSDEDVASFAQKLGTTVAKIKKAGWVDAARACMPGGG